MATLFSRADLVDIPPPSPVLFRHGINHPDLWLWDAWTVATGDTHILFTLALARKNKAGIAINPGDRNCYPFHVRQFQSQDGGMSWRDLGMFLVPSPQADSVLAHNVWSGSAIIIDGRMVFGFTGVRKPAPGRSFLQSICLLTVEQNNEAPINSRTIVISDPEADYQKIINAGYYLGPRETLGDDKGEEGGPILAWRDPFLIANLDGSVDAFWAAKTASTVPAVAHARLTLRGDSIDCQLLKPISLPDGEEFTQAEVPKVYRDPGGDGYLLLLSTCNRKSEEQPDDEVSKEMRLYRAARPDGPWTAYRDDTSIIPGIEHLFGGAFSSIDRGSNSATLIAPYTEMSAPDKQLTFAPPVTIDLQAGHSAAYARTGRV